MGRGKEFNPMMQQPPQAKPIMALVDAFCDTYKAVCVEEEADEIFSMGRVREYFNAWPVPKMPDPLGCYIEELESRGYAVQTTYDGSPAIFVVRWRTSGEVCGTVEEVDNQREKVRTGAMQVGALLGARKMLYQREGKKSDGESEGTEADGHFGHDMNFVTKTEHGGYQYNNMSKNDDESRDESDDDEDAEDDEDFDEDFDENDEEDGISVKDPMGYDFKNTRKFNTNKLPY